MFTFIEMDPNSGQNNPQNRGQNALQRRAQQLKRYYENENSNESLKDNEVLSQSSKTTTTKVSFSLGTLFLVSVQQNDFEECERLLATNESDINVTTGDGLTALHQMAIDDNQPMVYF